MGKQQMCDFLQELQWAGNDRGLALLPASLSPSLRAHSTSCLGISETSAEQKHHVAPFIQQCCRMLLKHQQLKPISRSLLYNFQAGVENYKPQSEHRTNYRKQGRGSAACTPHVLGHQLGQPLPHCTRGEVLHLFRPPSWWLRLA